MHAADPADPEAKALACYGLWLPECRRMLLRFVAGRPVSPVTCAFLAWVAERLAAEGMRGLALVWDNAGSPSGSPLGGGPPGMSAARSMAGSGTTTVGSSVTAAAAC